MSKSAKVAVITRTRNRPIFLKRAIQSILGQTFSDWIHIVVNDGGNPTLLEEAFAPFSEEYGDRLKIIHQDHSGMQAASNNGIKESLSDYIVIHDDDDSWHPDFLSETVAFLEAKGVDSSYQGVISQSIKIDESISKRGVIKELARSPYVPLEEISLFRIGYENPFPPIAFLYRRRVHDKIGLFDEQWDMVADLDFNFRFLKVFEIGIVAKPLAYYHWRTNKSVPANATNTVTAKAIEHGQKLNELKNHYIRSAVTANDAAIALGFQLSAFSVQGQWMTTDIREKTTESLHHLRGLSNQTQAILEQCNLIARFSEETLWEKIGKDIPEKFLDQKKRLEQLATTNNSIGEGISEIHKSQNGLVKLRTSLEQLRIDIDTQIWPKLSQDLPENLTQIHKLLAALFKNLEQLNKTPKAIDQLRNNIDQQIWPKLSQDLPENLTQIHKLLAALFKNLEQLNKTPKAIDQLRNNIDQQIWPKLTKDIPDNLTQIHKLLTALFKNLEQLNKTPKAIDQLRNNIDQQIWPKIAKEIPDNFTQLHMLVTITLKNLRQLEKTPASLDRLNASIDQQIWPKIAKEIPMALNRLTNQSDTLISNLDRHNALLQQQLDSVFGKQNETLEYSNKITGMIDDLKNEKILFQIGPLCLSVKKPFPKNVSTKESDESPKDA